MSGPQRLRDGAGPASLLLRGAELEVPGASRRRALAFAAAAAGVAASGTAVASTAASGTAVASTAASGTAVATATTSAAKGVLLWVCLGTIGGGLVSLGVAETIAHVEATSSEARSAHAAKPALRVAGPPARPAQPMAPPPGDIVEAPPETAPAPEPAVTRAASSAAPTPAPAASAARRSGTSLFDEQRSIESARAAVARGDAGAALTILDDYQRSYPQGQFGPEALALRVEAVRARGDLTQARSLAAQFARRYPHHPLLSRVQSAVQR
jgi:hypothetical protein